MSQCQAKSKRSGERCRRQAIRDATVCYYHGGKSLKGIASPRFRDGHASKYLPARYQQDLEAALAAPSLRDLSEDLAQLEARRAELFQRLDSGETGSTWRRAKDTCRQMVAAQEANEFEQAAALQAELSRTLEGPSDEDAWREIYELMERRRRLIDTEAKATLAAQNWVPWEFVEGMAWAIGRAVFEHVKQRAARAAIQAAISKYAGLGTPRRDEQFA